jgi:hypoxanthine phosphoribosyltransferase
MLDACAIAERVRVLAREVLHAGDHMGFATAPWRANARLHAADPGYGAIGIEPLRSGSNGSGDRERVHLVGLGPGSRRFLAELRVALEAEGGEVASDWLSLTPFRMDAIDDRVRIGRRPRLSVDGSDVVLVTDIINTGMSAAFVFEWLLRHGARSVRVCTLLDREEARILDVPVAWTGFTAPNDILVGYGITHLDQYGDLPHIAALRAQPRARIRAARSE